MLKDGLGAITMVWKQREDSRTRINVQHSILRRDVFGGYIYESRYTKLTLTRYHQAHEPLIDQQSIEGHSVRATYLLTAAADLVRIDGQGKDDKFRSAVFRLWDNMVGCKMYCTGGIGAIKQWEGFGLNYFLPQGTDEGGCYSETCAAIGVMMFAQRVLQVSVFKLTRRQKYLI